MTVEGVGLGLRAPLAASRFEQPPSCLRWLEVSPEKYMEREGAFVRQLHEARERWPIITLRVDGVDPLDETYLAALDRFTREVDTPWYSDYRCVASYGGAFLHDLPPLWLTDEAE